jgi:hypothetical protein
MPIDWEALEGGIKEALDRAEERTDDQLAARASSLTRLTDEEIKALFPTPADVDRLKTLMQIVKSGEAHNKKVTRLKANAEYLADVVIKVLGVLA